MHIFNMWAIIMQSFNIKEWNLLELQIKKTDTLYAFRMAKLSEFNTLKKIRKYL